MYTTTYMKFEDLFKKEEDVTDLQKIESEFTVEDKAYLIKERNREETLTKVMALYRKGRTYPEIMNELGLTYAQVRYAVNTVQERLKNKSEEDYLYRRNESIAELREMIRELWIAWEKSTKVDRKVTIKRATTRTNAQANTQNQSNQPPVQNARGSQEVEEQIEEMPGNVDYMKAIMWCRAEINRLEGLYAPKKIAQTDKDGNDLRILSAKDDLLNELQKIASRNNEYDQRKNLEAIEAEIVTEVNSDINSINPAKPTKLLQAIKRDEDN